MVTRRSAEMTASDQLLLGRSKECEVIDHTLAAAREGEGGALVLSGQAGTGKTALLDYAVRTAHDFRILRTVGIEWEMELPLAALQQMCAPMMDQLETLPEPQRRALGVAFGLSAGEPPERFLVGLAVLSLLSDLAAAQPILCVVDDAQWLDRASMLALAFVARRLLAERVALVFAHREGGEQFEQLADLPQLQVEGLRDPDAHALLRSAIPERLDERVRDQIVAETRGNPLALLELPRGRTSAELAGGFGLPGSMPLSGPIEQSFQRRLGMLPSDARLLLLLAAAEPLGDPLLLQRAADGLGVDMAAALAAQASGLLDVSGRVTFRHPLARSAVYRAASMDETRQAHRALAEATDSAVDPDRRAWHRAQSAAGPDDEIAGELERSAGRAQARGGVAAAAAFMERAATLTVEPLRRAERALAAAWSKYQAGAVDAALRLVSVAEAGPLSGLQRARADVLRAQVLFSLERGTDASSLMLLAAQRLEQHDVRLAREIYLDTLGATLFAGGLGRGVGAMEVARAARAGAVPSAPLRACELLLDGLTLIVAEGPDAGATRLREALAAFRDEAVTSDEQLRWLWIASRGADFIWDHDAWDALSARQVRLAREAGALPVLPLALDNRVGVSLFAGDLTRAAALLDEIATVAGTTESRVVTYGDLGLAAFRGRQGEATRLIDRRRTEFVDAGDTLGISLTYWATAALNNGLAQYEEAYEAAEKASLRPDELWYAAYGLVELIEAAARSGRTERAAEALAALSQTTRAGQADWGLSIEARSRALLAEGTAAEALYREAVDRLDGTPMRLDLARARLLYGEWLRRDRRRLDAREQLRLAHDAFTEFGMEAYAERTRVELRATGEHARKRVAETSDDLTPQEAQISRMAAEGATNQEIAAQLFISSSTVEYHLRKAYRKLGVRSRTQLAAHVLKIRSDQT